MRNRSLGIISAALGLAIACRLASQSKVEAPPAGPNLLINTDFRKNAKNLPEGWYFDQSLAGKGSVEVVPAGAGPALCLNPTAQNNDPNKPLSLVQMIFPEPFLGHRLVANASMKVAGGATAYLHLFALSRGKPVAQLSLSQTTGTPAFIAQQDSLAVPAQTDQLFFLVTTNSSGGVACFQNLRLVVADPDTPTAASPRPQSGSDAPVPGPPVTVAYKSAAAQSAAPAASLGPNLLQNADFRRSSNGFPEDWYLDQALASKGSVTIDRGGSRPGNLSLRLTPNSRNNEGAKPFGLAQIFPAGPYRGKRLHVIASLKVSPGGTAFVHLFALAGDRPAGDVTFTQTAPLANFRTQEDDLAVPNNADRLLFAITTNSLSGSASFDDLYVGETAGNRASRAAVAASAPGAASILVNATRVVRRIPAGLYGTNVEWVRNGNMIWDSSTNQPRPGIVARMREAGVSVIRYPGGGLADHFHWRDSIGPVRSRPVRPHVLDPESSQIVFGTAELIALCRMLRAEPLITINITEGTPQEAADWVAYCNRPVNPEREKNGSREPYRVKYWEIGNEQYIDDPTSSVASSYIPPDRYAKRFLEFVAAMKAADPSIVIGAVGGMNFGAYRYVKDEDWDARILPTAGKSIDFLSVHNGYAPLAGNTPSSQFFDVYKAMLAFPAQVEANLAKLSAQLDSYPSTARRTTIAVTEWGPLFAADVRSPWAGHPKTLGSALYVAGIFNAFLRSPRVEMATYLKATENNYMGWLYPNGDPKPMFDVLRLYRQHLGTKLTETAVSSPGFSSPAIGTVAAASNTPYLDAVSGLNDSGSRLTLAVVNRDFKHSWSTSIQIEGVQPSPGGTAWEITAESLDANNGEDLTPDPRLNWVQQARAPANPLYSRGKPGSVRPRQMAVKGLAPKFSYTFPPRSVTLLEMAVER